MALLQGIVSVTLDYHELKKAETKGEKYDVKSMKKRYTGMTLKEMKKAAGGDMMLYQTLIGTISSYDVTQHKKLVKQTILEDLIHYNNVVDSITREEINPDRKDA